MGWQISKKHDVLLGEILKSAHDKNDSLFGVQCAFESQQSAVCDYVVKSGESGTLSFHSHFLTASDCTAIGYVMKNAAHSVEKLVLDRCKLSDEGIHSLFDEVDEKALSVTTLCFYGKPVLEQCILWNKCLMKLESLVTLDLSNANLGSKKVEQLTTGATLPHLRTLLVSAPANLKHQSLSKLRFNSFEIEQMVLCGDGLSTSLIQDYLLKLFDCSSAYFCSMGSLARVKFSEKLQFNDVKWIAEGVKRQAHCTHLDLANCGIGDEECKTLVDGLVHCDTLRELVLSNNKISDAGAAQLSEAISPWTQLQSLDLSYNHIDNMGA